MVKKPKKPGNNKSPAPQMSARQMIAEREEQAAIAKQFAEFILNPFKKAGQ